MIFSIKTMPLGWRKTTIENVCEKVEYGSSAKSQSRGKIPVLRMGNIQNGKIDWKKLVYTTNAEEIEKYQLQYNDILFNRTNSAEHVGKTAIYKGEMPAIFAGYLIRIHRKKDLVDADFLNYYLNSFPVREYGKSVMSRSVNQANINGTKLKQYPIILPPLEEQKLIVKVLDEAFERIAIAEANTKKNLANAIKLFDSYLNKVFTEKSDRLVSLSDLCIAITDGDHQPPPKVPEGIPFITISNIDKQNRTIDFSDTFKVPSDYFNKLKEHRRPLQGDILYTVTGSYGIPVIVDDEKKFCFQRHIGLIRPNKETKSRFLYYLLLSEKVKKQADKFATGTAQKTVGLRSLRKFIVPNISLDDQIKIIKKLDDTSKEVIRLEEIYQRKLEALAELKQSILQKAFTGQLTN